MPKGWPMDGEQDWCTVEIEALAEAGVEDTVSRKPIGEFENAKTFNDGTSVQVKATVYPLYIDKVKPGGRKGTKEKGTGFHRKELRKNSNSQSWKTCS
ncbi:MULTISPECIES: hypothetical protein [Ruegeria]|uniref:hypothetical protein n=1 Tax=Ruegeria TaxID=97050 RepID=UPI0014804BF2|nr:MULTISPECIES: hypothetical protein [Ruegeria]